MSIRMLIDASHQEETRVAIVDGNKVEDFDYESSARKQLKGSIYLAKVTRVEPSLQAAFVDYGGNRHGFLAFSEIHPDYYQIPVADREALIAQEAAANADLIENADLVEDEDSDNAKSDAKEADQKEKDNKADKSENEDAKNSDEKIEDEKAEEEKPKRGRGRRKKTQAEETKEDVIESSKEEAAEDATSEKDDTSSEEKEVKNSEIAEEDPKNKKEKAADVAETFEEEEEERLRIKMAKRLRYKYKIQEVIKKNQIILIQVVKEERGNKGAALTTYLSLPGRYCVLMPNTLHGGGVSRKIANVKDRKKLKTVLASLNLPKGHACIIRTAGSDRTKVEIKRDYDYLKRMWEAIREHTLKSIAPSLIYEEGNLIKRSIRDLYTRDINEILVEGEDGYKTAKNFMSMLMPTHAKKVLNYVDPIPLFQRYQVETHLDSMYGPTAQLKSGGYIVINPTEALVSIDVNSGRATKEHNIEETAVNTNLEAADEIARQLKLRDMAGLVVIDFIDMEDQRNNRAVERKMKAALKNDRARIQVGRISSFGLMEMSRQRLRTGVLESSTTQCPHCEGSGLLRTVESQSLHILRIIEEEGIRARNSKFTVYLPTHVAVFILNNKRANLSELETRYDFSVSIAIDDELTASAYRMERSGKPSKTSRKHKDSLKLGNDVNKLIDVTEEDVSPNDEKDDRPKRRRRRRRNRNDRNANHQNDQKENVEEAKGTEAEQSNPEEDKQDKPRRRRRPRRNRRHSKDDIENKDSEDKKNENSSGENESSASENKQSNDDVKEADEKPKRKPRRTRKKVENEKPDTKTEAEPVKKEENVEEKPKRQRRTRKPSKTSEDSKKDTKSSKSETAAEEKPKPKRAPRKRVAKKDETAVKEKVQKKEKAEEKPKDDKPKKKGWWSRAMS